MNPRENDDLCITAVRALSHGVGHLSNFPGLLKKIIQERAWESRKVRTGQVVELKSLRELITLPPLEGWGEKPDKVLAVIKDEAEVLAMYREAMKGAHGGDTRSEAATIVDNRNNGRRSAGTTRAYTLSRLKRESPELFGRVCAGELSANAAAIEAGFRKKPTAEETCLRAFRKANNRAQVVRALFDELTRDERMMLLRELQT